MVIDNTGLRVEPQTEEVTGVAQVARKGIVYLIDDRNVVLSCMPEGLAPPEWRNVPPSREQKSKHKETAMPWLTRYCANLSWASEMCWLVRDASQEVWRQKDAYQGFAFINTADADAGIIAITYKLMRRNLDELSRWAAYEPVDPPFFSGEKFKDFAPEKAMVAAKLLELHDEDIKLLIRAAPKERIVVVITKDKNLREACRMAGAVVDGELVDNWYIDLARAWRQFKRSKPCTDLSMALL